MVGWKKMLLPLPLREGARGSGRHEVAPAPAPSHLPLGAGE
jgi:hypothetical protein